MISQAKAQEIDPDFPDRPATVTAACVLTWVVCLFTFMLGLIVIYSLLADRDDFVDRLRDEGDLRGVSADDVFLGLVVLAVVLVVWCLVAMVLAASAFGRSRPARTALVISAAVAALLSLPGVLVIYPIFTLISGVSVAVMLTGRASRQWYDYGRD